MGKGSFGGIWVKAGINTASRKEIFVEFGIGVGEEAVVWEDETMR